ncbi:hypothetical protein FJZ18_03070 [Candidatus Pacearchaeota archaeon]|nr:hypothetical protein [Candidatus Pacearchaeota archaeon]
MSRNLTKTPAFKLELFLEHPKNERLHQTAAFKPQWRIVFLISLRSGPLRLRPYLSANDSKEA